MGRCGSLWIVVGRCGSLWIVVDRCGSLWVVVGRCGSLWVVVGRCGSLWVVPGFSNYTRGPHRRDVTHILIKVSCFLLKSFHFNPFIFVGCRNDRFFPIQILVFRMLRNSADVRRCPISSLSYM